MGFRGYTKEPSGGNRPLGPQNIFGQLTSTSCRFWGAGMVQQGFSPAKAGLSDEYLLENAEVIRIRNKKSPVLFHSQLSPSLLKRDSKECLPGVIRFARCEGHCRTFSLAISGIPVKTRSKSLPKVSSVEPRIRTPEKSGNTSRPEDISITEKSPLAQSIKILQQDTKSLLVRIQKNHERIKKMVDFTSVQNKKNPLVHPKAVSE